MSTNAIADMLNGFIPCHWEDHVISIDNQNSMAKATWHYWTDTCAPRKLPISEANFVRMWKSILLRHVQDIYEREKHRRADHPLPISAIWTIPTPLKDLLSALGSYDDKHSGTHHRVVPPTPPTDFPSDSWWQLDGQITGEWCLTNSMMGQFSTQQLLQTHVFGAYHPPKDYTNRPLMLTARHIDHNGQVSIRAKSRGPRPEDAYIRAMNDELFEEPYRFEDCHIVMTSRPISLETDRMNYLGRKGRLIP